MWIKTSERLPEPDKPIWFVKKITYYDSTKISQRLYFGSMIYSSFSAGCPVFISDGEEGGYNPKLITHWQYANTPEMPKD